MQISYSRKALERHRHRQTAHQIRRRRRFLEESQELHEETFGKRAEFGTRTMTDGGHPKPRRKWGLFKSKT